MIEHHQTGVKVQQEYHNQTQNGETQSYAGQFQRFQWHTFLYRSLICAEQRGPIEETANHDGPNGMSSRRIHVEAEEEDLLAFDFI